MSNYKWSTGLFQCDANQNNGQGQFEFRKTDDQFDSEFKVPAQSEHVRVIPTWSTNFL